MDFFKSFFQTRQQTAEEKALAKEHAEFRNTVPCQKVVVGFKSPKTWRFFDHGDPTKAPVVCIPPAGGSADIFFKLFSELPSKGIRLIAVQSPGVYNHDEWIDSFNRFLDQIKIRKVHILGCGLGGFLTLLFTRVFPERVLSIILINSYSENTGLLDSTDKFEFTPAFVLRRVVYEVDETVRFSAKNQASVNFFKERMDDLDQLELYSALKLQCSEAFIDRRRINTTTLTIIESDDYSSLPPVVRLSLSNTFSSTFVSKSTPGTIDPSILLPARFVPLKKGGDFPFLSEDADVCLHLTVHMRRLDPSLLPLITTPTTTSSSSTSTTSTPLEVSRIVASRPEEDKKEENKEILFNEESGGSSSSTSK